jgi:peptide/nickel transport system ATP-binding protein
MSLLEIRAVTSPSGQGNAPLLKVEDLQTQFPTERGVVKAVDGVSFQVAHGEIVGIVGESGSGKTMMARSILRIVPPPGIIVSGRVFLNDRELTALSEREMARVRGRQISMIFQEPGAALNPVLTVGEQIVEVLRTHHGLNRSQARDRAVEHLGEVGIPAAGDRLRSYPHQLSGGMQQRCMIAIGLACGPQLLIADEPTTSLDVTIQAQILDLLVQLTQQRGVGLIFITHNIAAVAQIAQRIIVMYAGRVMEVGPTDRMIDEPQHPYTQALLQAMPTISVSRGQRLLEIKGRIPDLANVPPGCPFHPRCPAVMDECSLQVPALWETDPGRCVACLLYRADLSNKK